jgi:oxaloacetate decarboxylase gamma subunit
MVEQLTEAGILLAVGMSVVFAFLTLLIGGIHSIAWFSNLYPQAVENANKYNKPKYNKNSSTPTTVDPTVVSAITAAVHAHRRKGK